MVDRVIRYREKTPLFEQTGVEDAIRSTLSRRVDLPSGGYLVFDYAEAFTVIDVNTGRFVGSRSKSSAGRLEDTITANNLEAVKEVVHQLRLRDIGGIIVIDFIDMANPKNRATVEEALKTELERDRTKTYVVEISPLGLVEMTRQNVTEGPREILTQKCPTCAGDGIVLSTHSAAIDTERRLRALAAGSKRGVEAYRVELEENVASHVIGAGALRLVEIERLSKRRFFIEAKAGAPLDHFKVGAEGKLVDLAPRLPSRRAPRSGSTSSRSACTTRARAWASSTACPLRRRRVEAGRQEGQGPHRACARRDRVRDTHPDRGWAKVDAPITAESEAEKPTRAVRKKSSGSEGRGLSRDREGSRRTPRRQPTSRPRQSRTRSRSRDGGPRRRGEARSSRRSEPGAAHEAGETGARSRPQQSQPRTASLPTRCRSEPTEAHPPQASHRAGPSPSRSGQGRDDPRPVHGARHRGRQSGRRRRATAAEEAHAPRQPRRPKPPQEAGRLERFVKPRTAGRLRPPSHENAGTVSATRRRSASPPGGGT